MSLLELGAETILSFDDETAGNIKRAKLCKQFYPMVRDAVLRSYPWNCAIARTSLARIDSTPLFGFDYVFQLPIDPYCLRVLEIDDKDADYRIEGRYLLCDNSTVIIKFIKRVENTGLFDPLLVQAIVMRLAATLSKPITASSDMRLWELYANMVQEGKTIDGMEGTLSPYDSSILIDVRR